jgi:hypothetical protein
MVGHRGYSPGRNQEGDLPGKGTGIAWRTRADRSHIPVICSTRDHLQQGTGMSIPPFLRSTRQSSDRWTSSERCIVCGRRFSMYRERETDLPGCSDDTRPGGSVPDEEEHLTHVREMAGLQQGKGGLVRPWRPRSYLWVVFIKVILRLISSNEDH